MLKTTSGGETSASTTHRPVLCPRDGKKLLGGLCGFFFALSLLAATAQAAGQDEKSAVGDASIVRIPPGSGVIEEFLACEAPDGSRPATAPTPDQMPWRVSIGMPKTSPKRGSRADAREAAIQSMKDWERALQTELPWFELKFLMEDPDAPVQIKWARRMTGTAQARAGPTCRFDGTRLVAGGEIEIAIRSCPTCKPLNVQEVGLVTGHEFAHVLGLGHCLSCDSATNYSYQTEKRIAVTQVDVDAVVRRFAIAKMNQEYVEVEPRHETPVALAEGHQVIDFEEADCKKPFRLRRECSNKTGPRKLIEIDGLKMRLGSSTDGTMLLMMPEGIDEMYHLGLATLATNDRFNALVETVENQDVQPLRAMPVYNGPQVVGYYVEFDGNAWSIVRR